MIRVLFIDIDNTLLDFDGYVRETMKKGFQEFGLKPYTEEMFPVFRRINTELWQEIEAGELTLAELTKIRWSRILETLNIAFDGIRFEDYFREGLFHSAIPVDGAMEMLSYLEKRYRLCAASNGPYEQQRNRLKKAGMDSFFSHFFVSERIGASKPAEAFFTRSMEELNKSLTLRREKPVTPAEIMIIGDSLTSDMEGGRRSGLKTCLFDREHKHKKEDLAVDHIICDLREVSFIL
ncbi:MAG: YjjG family noncanonical pyrimidine nucleotidase [Clostridia bacterium]